MTEGGVFPCRSLERFARQSLWKESKFAQPLVRKKQTANGASIHDRLTLALFGQQWTGLTGSFSWIHTATLTYFDHS